MAVVDFDRGLTGRENRLDRGLAAALVVAGVAFAIVVLVARPVGQSGPAVPASATGDLPVPRGAILHPLQLPARFMNVDLGAMPDRLANEAPLSTLRAVITVRGVPGVASVEGPAVIAWTENAIAYRMVSPTRTTAELIAIAEQLQ